MPSLRRQNFTTGMGKGIFHDLGEWVAHNFLEGALHKLFADSLQALGIGVGAAAILVPVLASVGAVLLWRAIGPPPEPAWEDINPDDPTAVLQAFETRHIVASLATKLGETTAETPNEFLAQLRRLNLYGKRDVWDRFGDQLDPDDEELMHRLYSRPRVVTGLAVKVGERPAQTFEEFRGQVRRLANPSHS